MKLCERGRNPRQPIYQAVNEENALENLLKFEEKWGKKYSYAVKVWQNNWVGIKIIMDNAYPKLEFDF